MFICGIIDGLICGVHNYYDVVVLACNVFPLDYYFLEEVERCIDSAYRGRTYFNSKQHQGYKKMRKVN